MREDLPHLLSLLRASGTQPFCFDAGQKIRLADRQISSSEKKRVSKNAIAQLLGRFEGAALGRFISFTKPISLPNSVEIGED